VAAVLSTVAYYWYFVEPVQTIYIYWSEIPRFVTFVAFAVLLSWFGAVRRRAETGLRERAALLDLTHDTVFVMDMQGVIKYWNRGAEERYGWTAGQAVGKFVHGLLETVFPAPVEAIKAELERAGRWEGELRHTRKDGAHLVVASRWSLERGKHGEPVAILETNNDITARKHAEEAFRRLNRELRAISDCNQTLLRATDEQSLLNEICRIACQEAGYKMAWVAYAEHDEARTVRPVAWAGAEEGYLASAGITWADTERGHGQTGTAIRSGKTCCIQDFAADPRLAPWRESLLQRGFRSGIALPLKDENDNPFGSLTIHSAQPNAFTPEEIRLLEELAGDMAFGIVNLRSQAARKQAEQKIALLSFALDRVREAAFLTDDSGRFDYVNQEACRVLGYTPEELLGMAVADINPEFPAGRWSDYWRDLKARRSINFESRHRTRDGRIFPVEISANYIEYGGRAYNLGLVRDITERKRAEEALRQSEERLRLTLEATQIGTFDWDVAHDVWYASPVYYTALGYEPRDGPGDRAEWVARLHPEDHGRVTRIQQDILAGKSDRYEYEARMRHADGSYHWVQVKALGIEHDSGGKISRELGVRIDITERKRAEEALRESETRFRTFVDHAGDALFVQDLEQRTIVDVNLQACESLGYTRQELIGKSPVAIHLDSDRVQIESVAQRVATGETVVDRHYHRRKDGSVFPVEANTSCYWYGGRPFLLHVSRDITERVHAEEELRESETRFRIFVDHAADAFFVHDQEHKILDVNRQACENLGYSREELIGMHPLDFDPDMDAARLQRIVERLAAGEVLTFETRHRRKDGTVFPVEVRLRSFCRGDRRLHLSLVRDITERKRAEQERERLRRLEADLAHIDRVNILGELAASISHELNQPIAASILNASLALQWLERDPPDLARVRHWTAQIIEMGELAAEIIDRLRSLYRKEPPKHESLTINEVIGEMIVLLRGEAMRHGVSVRADLADSLPMVIADRVQVQQVLMNLMLNGIEAMSDTGGVLTVKSQPRENGQVEISVNDTGPGLPPGKAGQIFDAFFTTKPKGSGMGLAISKSIVESHGGRIWVNGNGGRGATFHFTLLAAPSETTLPADLA
jgi:PAS domain S-box-containing protein